MKTLEVRRVTSRVLAGVDLECDPGVFVVVGGASDGTHDLIRILAGAESPRRGSVTIRGVAPFKNPAMRRRIGAVFTNDRLPPASTVAKSIAATLAARGDSRTSGEILGSFELESWASRSVRSLDDTEHRTLALMLALSVPSPVLLALAEPFACAPIISVSRVTHAIAHAVACDAVVICAMAIVPDAALLSAPVRQLERGSWAKTPRFAPDDARRLSARAVIRTERPRELAAALSRDPHIIAVSFEASAPRGEVYVTAADSETVALAVSRVARREDLPIHSIDTSWAAPPQTRGAP